jgi:hypothetical protein
LPAQYTYSQAEPHDLFWKAMYFRKKDMLLHASLTKEVVEIVKP